MFEASCSATMRSSSSASSAPCSGRPREKRIARQVVRVRQVIDARQHRAEELAVVDHAADRDAAEADAVVAALAADQAGARAFAAHAVIGERDLERGVDRLGARVREEHVVEALRRDLGERVRELERRSGGPSGTAARSPSSRSASLTASVISLRPWPGVDAPEARDAVEDLAAVGRPVVHALGAREQARVRLELPVGRERHPEGFERAQRGLAVMAGSGSAPDDKKN